MITAVTGGKGGTGKTSVALSLALSREEKVTYVDADVETPNAAVLLGVNMVPLSRVTRWTPEINEEKCTHCGLCAQACPLHALVHVPGKVPLFFEDRCVGCKLCREACPVGAIEDGKTETGVVRKGVFGEKITLYDGLAAPNVEETAPVVQELVRTALERERGDVIIDTAAGIHCNVIRALLPADRVIVVTEPTPYGVHDLEKIVRLVRIMEKPFEIYGNKWGISPEYQERIEEIAGQYGVPLVKIPFSKEFASRYAKGEFVPLGVR